MSSICNFSSSMFLLMSFVFLSIPTPGDSRRFNQLNPAAYLPKDAKVAKIAPGARKTNWADKRGSLTDAVIQEDLDGDGIEEVVIFYTQHEKCTVVVFKWNDSKNRYVKIWEWTDYGIGFDTISNLWDVNGGGKRELVLFRWLGASAGGALDIFEWGENAFKKISPDWNVDVKAVEFRDLDHDGVDEIILSHRFDLPTIYQWNGKSYASANKKFPAIFESETKKYAGLALSNDPRFSSSDLVTYCEFAIHGLVYQEKYKEALTLCNTVADMARLQNDHMLLSKLYVLMGDVYREMNRLEEGLAWYKKALNSYPSGEAKRKALVLEKLVAPSPR